MTKTAKEMFLEDLALALTYHAPIEMEGAHFIDFTSNSINYFSYEVMDEDMDDEYIATLPAWQQEMAKDFIEHDLMRIYPISSNISFNIMEDFASTQPANKAKYLYRALEKRRPFANFKIAAERAGILQEWYSFKNAKELEMAENWLTDNGLEYVDGEIRRKP